MKINSVSRLIYSASLGAAAILFPALLFAQAPPGPITLPDSAQPRADSTPQPPPPPRWQGKPTILGSWKFDRDESDDARDKMRSLSQSNGNSGGRRGGGGGGYPGGGGGYPGGGGGGGGYGRGRGGIDSYSDADKARLGDLMNPSYSLTVAQKENQVEMNDEQDRKRVFFTDGRKPGKATSDTYHEITAKWDDDRLVSTEEGPRSGKIERILTPADGGMQLYETFRMTDSHSNPTVVVRYVFNRVMPPAQPAAQTKTQPPAQPQPTKP
ncbi:MAG TPA: hypothetical protein VJW51_10670 [Candidatus Acidoferrales bacterium]|nr:hypothetical protein [Candidatus Acidoferrales bacterium]